MVFERRAEGWEVGIGERGVSARGRTDDGGEGPQVGGGDGGVLLRDGRQELPSDVQPPVGHGGPPHLPPWGDRTQLTTQPRTLPPISPPHHRTTDPPPPPPLLYELPHPLLGDLLLHDPPTLHTPRGSLIPRPPSTILQPTPAFIVQPPPLHTAFPTSRGRALSWKRESSHVSPRNSGYETLYTLSLCKLYPSMGARENADKFELLESARKKGNNS